MQVEHAMRGVSGVLVALPSQRAAMAELMTPAEENLVRWHYAGPGIRIKRSTSQCGRRWSYVHPMSCCAVAATTGSAW